MHRYAYVERVEGEEITTGSPMESVSLRLRSDPPMQKRDYILTLKSKCLKIELRDDSEALTFRAIPCPHTSLTGQ